MPPITLFRYISSRMVFSIGVLFAALASLVLLVDLIENMRFAGKFENANFSFALQLTLLRTAGLAQALIPFVFLFGSIWMFNQLNRRSELSVMRSAGLSVWRLIGPAAFIAAMSGFFIIVMIDPISAQMTSLSEKMKNDIRGRTSSLVQVFGDGIWLRQRDENSVLLINAAGFDNERAAMTAVTMWRLGPDAAFLERVDAPEAHFIDKTIELHRARLQGAGDQVWKTVPVYAIPTPLTPKDLRERVPPPESMSVWDLPRFILLAEAAGLPTVRYNIRFHDLCSTPLKLVAMVLIAALFSLRPVRSGGGFKLLLYSVGAGFALYILSEISSALGESGTAPVALAAWTPAIVATIVAISGLLQMEDG